MEARLLGLIAKKGIGEVGLKEYILGRWGRDQNTLCIRCSKEAFFRQINVSG